MLTEEDDVEIHALARRGWSVSAIARHTGRDRKTVSKYLAGPAAPREPAPSCLQPFREYLVARFVDDAHVDGTVLHREVLALGFDRSYVTFVRQLRLLGLRPRCEACRSGGHGVTVELAHEPGEEIQFDWLELHETPWGEPAYVLVGALSFSGRCRAVICEGMTFAHWSTRSTACCAGWAAPRARGGPIGWRPSCIRAAIASPHSSRRRPSITASRSGFARPGARSARASSRRRSST